MKTQAYAPGPWTITSIRHRPKNAQRNGAGIYTYVTMKNTQGEIVHTSVEKDFRNYKNWAKIFNEIDSGKTVTIDNVYYKTEWGNICRDNTDHTAIIDADSKPSIVKIIGAGTVGNTQAAPKKKPPPSKPDTFNGLFGI